MDILDVDLRSISETDARAAAELLVAVWPKPGRTVDSLTQAILEHWREYNGAEAQHPRSLVVRDSARIVGHASVYPRTLGTPAGDITVLALARVCTAPETRGQGLGQALVERAFILVDNHTFPFALFQTNDKVRSFYEKLGAAKVDNQFINSKSDNPRAWPFWDPHIMRYPNTAGWPEGEIDLRGPGW